MVPSSFAAWLQAPPASTAPWRPPLVMGVLNVTPDSFSDAGEHLDPSRAAQAALQMAADGADLIDIGAESTRPGASRVAPAEQIRRLRPVLKAISAAGVNRTLSIDTTSSEVTDLAIDHGVTLVNDISAGRDDPGLLPLVARRGVAVCLMHMQGEPATMQAQPAYGDVVTDVRLFLENRLIAARDAGIDARRILIDPGIGFGKSADHNLQLLRRLNEFTSLDRPILIGTSRKGFIGRVTGVSVASQREFGTAATVSWSLANGADIVRVHDLAAMVQVVRMTVAMMRGAVE